MPDAGVTGILLAHPLAFISCELKTQHNFLPGRFLFDLTFSVCLLVRTFGVNKVCTKKTA